MAVGIQPVCNSQCVNLICICLSIHEWNYLLHAFHKIHSQQQSNEYNCLQSVCHFKKFSLLRFNMITVKSDCENSIGLDCAVFYVPSNTKQYH